MAEQKPTRRRRSANQPAATADTQPQVDTREIEAILGAQEELNAAPVPELDEETRDLLAAQAEMQPLPAPPVHHPLGTMNAGDLVGEPVILAPRSNGKSTTSGRQLKLKGPKNPGDNPIAVVSRDGSVYPFSGETRDRVALLGYDVTYIYDIDDAKMVIEHNERVLRDGNADRVIHGFAMEAPPLPTADNGATLREELAVAFSPEMIKG